MKREILFKGKTVHGNLWIESHSIIQYDGKVFFAQLLIENDKKTIIEHEIVKETLSQFTGLTDKNGIKIFEWDKTSNGYVVMWSKEKALFCEFFQLKLGNRWSEASYPIQDDRIEIIGNIHDNG